MQVLLFRKKPMLEFKSILITGASHGIGRTFAVELARPGVILALCALDDLSDTIAKCHELGTKVVTTNLDIRSKEFVRWVREFGKGNPIDFLIANAGISPATSRYGLDRDVKSAVEILSVNLLGTVTTVNAIMGKMAARKSGNILIMSSIAAYVATGDSPAYCSSKLAILSYGRAIHHRLKDYGVKVTVACPGCVKTRLTKGHDVNEGRMLSPATCVKKNLNAVYCGKTEVAFPLKMALRARLIYAMPQFFVDWYVKKVQYN